MSNNLLDYFGKSLIENVRDNTIQEMDKMLSGKAKGLTAKEVQSKISGLSKNELDVIDWLVPQIIDLTLHNLLWTIEEEDKIKIAVEVDKDKTDDLKNESDGLSGELYTEDGWISKFSNERYEEI